MKIIIDTNLWVSSCFGKHTAIMEDILLDKRYDVYVCKELVDEVMDVLSRPKISKYISSDDIHEIYGLLTRGCKMVAIKEHAISVIRDPKDLYLLSLADTIQADLILSGDKDLLTLEQHHSTRIISLSDFKEKHFYN